MMQVSIIHLLDMAPPDRRKFASAAYSGADLAEVQAP
jgi:hypothetical protein